MQTSWLKIFIVSFDISLFPSLIVLVSTYPKDIALTKTYTKPIEYIIIAGFDFNNEKINLILIFRCFIIDKKKPKIKLNISKTKIVNSLINLLNLIIDKLEIILLTYY